MKKTYYTKARIRISTGTVVAENIAPTQDFFDALDQANRLVEKFAASRGTIRPNLVSLEKE